MGYHTPFGMRNPNKKGAICFFVGDEIFGAI
jgi:hypothetical protein